MRLIWLALKVCQPTCRFASKLFVPIFIYCNMQTCCEFFHTCFMHNTQQLIFIRYQFLLGTWEVWGVTGSCNKQTGLTQQDWPNIWPCWSMSFTFICYLPQRWKYNVKYTLMKILPRQECQNVSDGHLLANRYIF